MQTVIEQARTFRQRIAGQAVEFGRLANGQSPEVLFISCSDSRIVPSMIVGSGPGELFELRTAGNIVPPHDQQRPSGEAATIEYAVQVLGVSDIVLCGHSHCGAVGALARGDSLDALPAVQSWLLESGAVSSVIAAGGADDPAVAAAVQRHVVNQVERLCAYPEIYRRLRSGGIRVHGWFYEVHTGAVLTLRQGAFEPV